MGKIALVIDDAGAARAKVAAALHRHLHLGLGDILNAITERRPVIECALFPRDNPEFPAQLLAAIESLDRLQVTYAAFELLDHQTLSTEDPERLYRVTADRLRNMIETDEKSLEWVRRQARLEDGVD